MGTNAYKQTTLSVVDAQQSVVKACGVPADPNINALIFYVQIVADPKDKAAIRRYRRIIAGYEQARLQIVRGAPDPDSPPLVAPTTGNQVYMDGYVMFPSFDDVWWVPATNWIGTPSDLGLTNPEQFYYHLRVTAGLKALVLSAFAVWTV